MPATRSASAAASRRTRSRSPSCPQHTHAAQATSATGDTPIAPGNLLADSPSQLYAAGNSPGQTALSPTSVTNVGGSQAHLNMQPFLTLNFGIALIGIFPSPN